MKFKCGSRRLCHSAIPSQTTFGEEEIAEPPDAAMVIGCQPSAGELPMLGKP